MWPCSNNTNASCLNGAECIDDACKCPSECYLGSLCETYFNTIDLPFSSAMAHDTVDARIVYITFITALVMIGLLNNLAALMTFTRESIRITACGVYLIVFAACTTVRSIFLQTIVFTVSGYDTPSWRIWSCYANPYMSLVLGYTCIWLSVGIAVERVLIECFNMNLYETRRHAIFVSIVALVYSSASNLPAIFAREFLPDPLGQVTCVYDYQSHRAWSLVDTAFSYVNLIVPCTAHLVCTVCILTTIARRKILICKNSQPKQRLYRVWLQQLYIHQDFLVPPFFLIVCLLPNAIHGHLVVTCVPYFNLEQLRVHIAFIFLLNIPSAFVFIVYIYPSQLYTKEFKQTYFYKILCCGLFRVRQRKYQPPVKLSALESMEKPSL